MASLPGQQSLRSSLHHASLPAQQRRHLLLHRSHHGHQYREVGNSHDGGCDDGVQVHVCLSSPLLQRLPHLEERHLQGPHVRHTGHCRLQHHKHPQAVGAGAGL